MTDESRASIEHMSGENAVIAPPEEFAANAVIPDRDTYAEMYRRSIEDPEGFWGDAARAELEGALQGQPSGEWVEAARGLLGRLP